MRGINTIILHYHYRVGPKLIKGVSMIRRIICVCPTCAAKIDKDWFWNITPSSQPTYTHVENCSYNKTLDHYNDWIIVELLDNKIPQVHSNNIYALIISGMSINKAEPVKVNWCGAIYFNYKAANNFTLFLLHLYHIQSKKMRNQMEIN